MVSVQEAAKRLDVSGARVRAMLKSGHLEGVKIGKVWAVSEASLAQRLNEGAIPGRPVASKPWLYERALPDVEVAHRLYDEAVATLSGCYIASLLDQARTEEEQAFWIHVADFFLQQKQRELVEKGVF